MALKKSKMVTCLILVPGVIKEQGLDIIALAMTNTARLPAWLNSINNPGHVDTVLQTLAQREATRSAHRSPPLPEGGNGVQRPIRTVLNHLLNKPDPQQFYSVAAGTCPENLQFNRYLDIEPYDRYARLYLLASTPMLTSIPR